MFVASRASPTSGNASILSPCRQDQPRTVPGAQASLRRPRLERQGARDAAGITGPLSPDRYYDRLPSPCCQSGSGADHYGQINRLITTA
jgi:hypothetical protein